MLAIDGGTPVRDGNKNPWPTWPVWGEEEKQALVEVLESGVWSYNGPKETEFLKLWQEYSGAGHVLLAANGTVTLQLALEALRNCGRRPANVEIDKSAGQYGLEGDLIQSGNYRITDFQAAVLIHQFGRMEAQNSVREENARYLDLLLKEISGVNVMKDDPRETKKAYFNYAFRIDENAIGMKAQRFRTAFSAEIGFEAESCYQPLNDCTLYRPQTKSRHDLSEAYWKMIDPSRFHLPVSNRLYAAEAVCFHHRFLMGPKSDMDQIAAAVNKVHHGE